MAIQFDLDARDIGLAKELDKNEKKVIRLTNQVKKLKKGLNDTGKEGGSAMGDLAKSMLPVVTIATAIGTAFKLVKGEIDRVLEAGKKASELKKGVGMSEAKAWSNLQTQGIFANMEQFRKMGKSISLDTGLGIPEVNAIMSTAASTAPNAMSQQQFSEKVTLAAKGQAIDFSSGPDIARVINTVEKLTGSRDSGQNFAFGRSFLGQSNMEDFKGVSYALRGALGEASYGNTPLMSARMLATMSKLSDDPKGRMTGTGVANMNANLARKLFPLGGGKEGFLPGENMSDRLAALQKVFPGLGVGDKAFAMSQIGGKATTKASVEEMLMNTPMYQRIHAGSVSNINAPGSPKSEKLSREYWEALGTGSSGFATANKKGTNAAAMLNVESPKTYMSSIVKKYEEIMANVGTSAASVWDSIQVGNDTYNEFRQRPDYFRDKALRMASDKEEATPEFKTAMKAMEDLIEQFKESKKRQDSAANSGEQD